MVGGDVGELSGGTSLQRDGRQELGRHGFEEGVRTPTGMNYLFIYSFMLIFFLIALKKILIVFFNIIFITCFRNSSFFHHFFYHVFKIA